MKRIEKISEKNPFKVPEKYFEEVSVKIIESTIGKTVEKKNTGVLVKLRISLAAAASVAVLSLLVYTVTLLFSPADSSVSLSQILIRENPENILNEIDLLTLEESAMTTEFPEEELPIDQEAIVDFLLFDNIDINMIYDQL